MSNALAIATVTRALAFLIERAAKTEVSGAEVVTSRPESTVSEARVHLFLYQVLPDPTQRNDDLPSRPSDGHLVRQRPTIALNLHYLVTFNGNDKTLEPHKMLGAVARDLHAQPLLSRALIASVSNDDLAASNLADALDVVRVSSLPLNVEDLSKLWLMFSQIPYSLSVAYEARVLLIEALEPAQPALPVLTRGEDDRGVETAVGPFPVLDDFEVSAPGTPTAGPRLPPYPSAQLGLQITFQGRNLGGDSVTLRFSHARLADLDLTVPAADRTADRLRVVLPDDAAAASAFAAGIYTVAAIVTSGGSTRTSNALPVPLAPAFTAIAPPSPITGAGTDLGLTLTCRPRIAARQRAELLVAGLQVAATPPSAATDTLAFTLPNAPATTDTFMRLRVDGVDSVVFRRQDLPAPPRFVLDDSTRISIL